ncbi:MAG: extracellular solute-binding protein [Oscillospiraceae bacterium]|jgi:multiple sugar transport system substrate-binding protein|nr:extracellular solute-binding protein [Oscillospiraceae bacterium]MBR3585454.1 extracellular solute-binding protein [Oscillospiraceae bacterium]
MKRILAFAIVLVLMLTVCSVSVFADGVTLNALFMKQAGYSEEDVTAMTQAFTESTGIQVNPTFVAYEELAPKILTSAASGGYDVILGDCIWPAQFAKAGLVLNVTDRLSELDLDDIYQGALDATKYEGQYYGMPWLNDVKYMFVNMELLKQAGVDAAPTTWDELIADAKLCKDQGICEYPIVGCYAQAECLVCDYTCIAGSFGGAFVDENNNPTLNSPENVAALDFMAQTLKDGLCNPKSLEMIEDDVLSTFAAGNAVFAINWTYQYASMNDESTSSVVGQGAITPIPGTDKAQSATVNGGMPLMITAGCKNPDEAWDYMLFLASKEMQAKYCANALPIWKSLYTDPQVIETAGEAVVEASQIQFDYIVNRPMVPYYSELSTSMQTELQLVLLGQKTAQEALDGLQTLALDLANQ